MKRFTTLALALVAVLAVTAVAVAQVAPVINLTGSVSPSKGGTTKKPKNAKLKVSFDLNRESAKTVSRITYFVPKNIKLSGKGFRYCPASTLNKNVGDESKCPKGSKIGTGTATAELKTGTKLNFTVGVFAGSANELALNLKGPVNVAFRGLITNAGLPFGQKITVDIPNSAQQPAPGLYAYLTNVTTTIGGSVKKKVKGKTRSFYFASLTGCPKDGTHDLGVQLGFSANDTGGAGASDRQQATADCS